MHLQVLHHKLAVFYSIFFNHFNIFLKDLWHDDIPSTTPKLSLHSCNQRPPRSSASGLGATQAPPRLEPVGRRTRVGVTRQWDARVAALLRTCQHITLNQFVELEQLRSVHAARRQNGTARPVPTDGRAGWSRAPRTGAGGIWKQKLI